MITYSLISIDNINQIIPALAALQQYKDKFNAKERIILLLTKPHLKFSPLMLSQINALLQNQGSYVLIIGNNLFKQKKLITYLPVRIRQYFLHKKLNEYPISEIFFAHDNSSDFWNQTLMHAFPKADRICYGDALGIVYSHSYFTQLMYRYNNNGKILFRNIIARLKRYFLYPSEKNQLFANKAILAIPCDPGKDFFTQCELSIISKDLLVSYVKKMMNCIPDFKTHMHDLLAQQSKTCYLLMLSNFTESKLTTLENEIALYKEILAVHATKDNLIIIKPHPAHNPLLFEKIITSLREDYIIKVIDQQFYHLPIELAESMIEYCDILSVSYSSISLPYIFEKKVKHVLTQELINKYFSLDKMDWFSESNNLYLRIIEALKYWTHDHELSI